MMSDDFLYSTENAFKLVEDFGRKFGVQHVRLAMHAAVPLSLTPELLNLLRVNFVFHAEPIAEPDLLLSPLCEEIGGELYELLPSVRQLLREEMLTDRDFGYERVEEVCRFLHEYARRTLRQSDPLSPSMREFFVAQRWDAAARIYPKAAAKAFALEIDRGLHSTHADSIVHIAALTDMLSKSMPSEARVLYYASAVSQMVSGEMQQAQEIFDVLGASDQPFQIQDVILPSAVSLHHTLKEVVLSEAVAVSARIRHPKLFLSYTRSDEGFAERLYRDLVSNGFDVWWDRASIPSQGISFTDEIRAAVQSSDRVVLIIGHDTSKSTSSRAEWEYALAQCLPVHVIRRSGAHVPNALINYELVDMRDDSEAIYTAGLNLLLQQLSSEISVLGALHNVPNLPENYRKQDDYTRLKEELLQVEEPVARLTSPVLIQGAGGFGKTTTATALCHDCEIRRSFRDGVYWLTLGQSPDHLAQYAALGQMLGDNLAAYTDEAASRSRLQRLFENRRSMIVLDDVWSAAHIRDFISELSNIAFLITTRNEGIAREGFVQEADAILDHLKKQESTRPPLKIDSNKSIRLIDGRILSWSQPVDLVIYSSNGQALVTLMGHTAEVQGALALADGRLLSWSADRTLRLWSGVGQPLVVLEGHTDWVAGAVELADRRLLSWSIDQTLRLWSTGGAPIAVIEGHTDRVNGVLAVVDGRILSWSDDATLRLWAADGSLLAILTGHTGWVAGALTLADGRLLSWSSDATLRLWAADGAPLAALVGHTERVNGALALVDGQILSWSDDATLRLWAADGSPVAMFTGHTARVTGALTLPDGRLLSWGDDSAVRLWSIGGALLHTLTGHVNSIASVVILSDGRILTQDNSGAELMWSPTGNLIDNSLISAAGGQSETVNKPDSDLSEKTELDHLRQQRDELNNELRRLSDEASQIYRPTTSTRLEIERAKIEEKIREIDSDIRDLQRNSRSPLKQETENKVGSAGVNTEVFISSTSRDLSDHRKAAQEAVLSLGMSLIMMEDFPASSKDPLKIPLDMVARSEIYVLLVGQRYGYIPDDPRNPDQLSIVELEYNEAIRLDKPVFIFAMDDQQSVTVSAGETDPTTIEKLRRFRNKLLQKHVIDFFTSPDDLASKIAPALSYSQRQEIRREAARPRSIDLLPAPFAWIDIPAGEVGVNGQRFSLAPFKIAKYPVTNAQFAKFVEAGSYVEKRWWTGIGWEQREKGQWNQPRFWQDSQWNGPEQPVVGVTWFEVIAFCVWLSEMSEERIALPTEVQYQYAAQGNDNRAYPWGNAWDGARCNADVSNKGTIKTTPVRQYERAGVSPFGVADMSGNIFEWCLTDYDSGSTDITSPGRRVIRGGSWADRDIQVFRCDYRSGQAPTYQSNKIGFRLVVT